MCDGLSNVEVVHVSPTVATIRMLSYTVSGAIIVDLVLEFTIT